MTFESFIGELIYIALFTLIIVCGIPLLYGFMCCLGNLAAYVLQCFIEGVKSWNKM